MQPNRCMWLHLEESDATANEMVLTEQEVDVVVHNKQSGDESQQWEWDETTKKIKNIGSGLYLKEEGGDAALDKVGSEWFFDSENHTLRTKISAWSPHRNDWVMNKYLSLPKEGLMPGSEADVLMARSAEGTNFHWRIEYCDIHLRN